MLPKPLTCIDLFCGGGLFSAGFQEAGFRVLLGVDIEPAVRETFEKNHPGADFLNADILTLEPKFNYSSRRVEVWGSIQRDEDASPMYAQLWEGPQPDVIIGSPPCKEVSTAKNARGTPKPELTLRHVNCFLKWIEELTPRFWVMENVKGVRKIIANRAHMRAPFRVKLFNSADFGVPQTRERVFAGQYPMPRPTHSEAGPMINFEGKRIERWVTVREAISDLPFFEQDPAINHVWGNHQGLKDALDGDFKQGRRVIPLDEPAPTVTENHGNTVGILRYSDVINNDTYSLDEPARTVRQNAFKFYNNDLPQKGDGHASFTDYLRVFSCREMARLQSVSDDFIFYGSIKAMNLMIGNGVPCKMAQAVAEAIRDVYAREYQKKLAVEAGDV